MTKEKLKVDWKNPSDEITIDIQLKRYDIYLQNIGIRDSTRARYVDRVKQYLRSVGKPEPDISDFGQFRNNLIERKLAKSTINNYSFSARQFHKMLGQEIEFPFLRPNNIIPYYFNMDEIKRILDVSRCNLKHHTMLTLLFHCGLRATELCNINLEDVELIQLTLRIRSGKSGNEALVPISNECASVIEQYLAARPSFKINNTDPLFFTDFGRKWDRRDLYRMFMYYKKKAKIKKPGGLHVFSRHSLATLMIEGGIDVTIVSKILRHKSIATTMRYLHISSQKQRSAYVPIMCLYIKRA